MNDRIVTRPDHSLSLESIDQYLADVESRVHASAGLQDVTSSISDLKAAAVRLMDETLANRLWCLQHALSIQNTYIDAFLQLKKGEYYRGWCLLEQVEIGLRHLRPHMDITHDKDRYKLAYINEHFSRFQQLFPYRLFVSPAFLQIEKRCSICDSPVSIRQLCGHEIGKLYWGEMCHHKVTKAEILEISLVTNPVQKYSVVNLGESDSVGESYDYTLLSFLLERLEKPFDGWNFKWSKQRQPHERYRHLGRNDPCPCESGLKYKRCCLHESGVLRPHIDYFFEVPPPQELLEPVYTD